MYMRMKYDTKSQQFSENKEQDDDDNHYSQ